MLKLQEALQSGKTIQELETELGISSHVHPELPLIGLTYDMLESPKTHPIVRECRGIVLEKDTWKVVAKAFNRFFNAEEVQEEFLTFNWDNFVCNTKCDGSLILLFNYQNKWIAKTKGSFGDGVVPFPAPGKSTTFSQLFWETAKKYNLNLNQLDPKLTYAFEICSLYNKVVRIHPEPKLYLLSVFDNTSLQEFSITESAQIAKSLKVDHPIIYDFASRQEIEFFLQALEKIDPSNEGVVIRDDKNLRYKLKTETYKALHNMCNNGNLYRPKSLVPFALNEDPTKLLTFFPEAKEFLESVVSTLNTEWEKLKDLWETTHQIENQKDFAKAIVGKSKFSSLLFQLRGNKGIKVEKGYTPGNETEEDLKIIWRSSGDFLVKVLYSD